MAPIGAAGFMLLPALFVLEGLSGFFGAHCFCKDQRILGSAFFLSGGLLAVFGAWLA